MPKPTYSPCEIGHRNKRDSGSYDNFTDYDEISSSMNNDSYAMGFVHGRVIGGFAAIVENIPWQVCIRGRDLQQFCAGTLITPTWIVTAAHCMFKKRPRDYLLTAGHTNRG